MTEPGKFRGVSHINVGVNELRTSSLSGDERVMGLIEKFRFS